MYNINFNKKVAGGKDGTIYETSEPDVYYKELFHYKTPEAFNDTVDRDARSYYSSEPSLVGNSRKSYSKNQLLKIPRIISNLKLNNFVKIIEINDGYSLRRSCPGYLMKKYTPSIDTSRKNNKGEPKNKSLLDFPISYIIDNYIRINEDIDLLWKKGISLRDYSNFDNYIITDDGIIFIDVDGYALVKPIDRIKNKIGIKKTDVYKVDTNYLFSTLIRNAMDYLDDDRKKELMRSEKWTNLSTRDEFNILEELLNYDKDITLFDYLKIKTQELENKKVK